MRTIPDRYETHHAVVVTPAMTVDFEHEHHDPRLGKLHPVYATYWLTKHMELVSRKIILPFLEPGEEGIGHAVEVRHLASALPGMRVDLQAAFVRMDGNRVHATCIATSELGDRIGEGATIQVIVPVNRLDGAFERLRQRWERHRGGA
ncbi:MAG: thioesterase [Trueperaceae bacterium]